MSGRELPRAPKRRGILSEETVQRGAPPEGDEDLENPYWLDEDPQEHPNPELGCIRRGLCCKSSPGAFAPGEAEGAAALLGLEPDVFVRRYLVIDALTIEGKTVHAFAPVKLGQGGRKQLKPGTLTDRLYHSLRGPCVFFKGEGCMIYEARPLECQRYLCTQPEEQNLTTEELARLWLTAAGGESEPSQEPPPEVSQ